MTFVGFLELYWQYIVAAVMFILAVVAFIVTLFTKRSVSQATKNFLGVLDMSKNVGDLASKTLHTKQSFSNMVPDYILSDKTGELERSPVDKDIQAYIDSYIDTALERALRRFSVPNAVEDNAVADYTQSIDDLASLADAIEVAEDYRDKLHLPDSASISDIYAAVDKRAQELKVKIDSINKGGANNVETENTEQKS